MVIKILSREQEEQYLLNPDNTCQSGTTCIYRSDFNSLVSGKALARPGDLQAFCILCIRKRLTDSHQDQEQIYFNCDSDYHRNNFLTIDENNRVYGPCVKYNKKDYKLADDKKGIIQNLEKTSETYFKVFEFLDVKEPEYKDHISSGWSLLSCPNPKCPIDILNFVSKCRSLGIDNTVYDVKNQEIQCLKCKTKVETKTNSQYQKPILHNGKYYSKCYFCQTVTPFQNSCVETCDECKTTNICYSDMEKEQCYYCNTFLYDKKTKRSEYKVLINDKDIETIFLCQKHSINNRKFIKRKNENDTMITLEDINNLLFKK